MRKTIAALAEYWNETLTQKERENWNKKADTIGIRNQQGKLVRLSGFNLFLREGLTKSKS